MTRTPDRVVVITGAASGIGRATALAFARRGGALVLTGRRAAALERLARECGTLGGRAIAIAADIADREAVDRVARRGIEAFGRVDVWVNNAAATVFGRLEDVPYGAYRRVIETNLFGCIHGARAALPHFRSRGRGTLVNVSSVIGKIGSPYVTAYAASKFAIAGLSESLRMELRDAPDIHVCTVLPASIDTPLFQHAGNYAGRAVRPLEPLYDARQVAEAIVKAVDHPRREVVVGAAGSGLLALRTLAPGLAEAGFARRVSRQHFQDRPAAASEGNLFEPLERYETVDGGWRTGGRGSRSPAGVILGGAAIAGALALLLARIAAGRRLP